MSEFDSPLGHHLMLRDYVRVMAYRSAIFAQAKDRVVAEIGCGTGILSIFAAQAGAKKVYAIEQGNILALAKLMFRANHCDVTPIRGNSREIELPEKVDLIIHEILGPDPFNEDLIPTIRDAKERLLKKDGRLLPRKIQVWCVGAELAVAPSPTERIFQEAAQFSSLYGVSFEPYLLALEAHRDGLAMSYGRGERPPEKLLSEATLLREIDLDAADWSLDAQRAEMRMTSGGRLGALDVFFRAQLDDRFEINTSPFAPTTSWGRSVRDLPQAIDVKAGDRVTVTSRVERAGGRDRILVDVGSC
jgi:hypothetical protein